MPLTNEQTEQIKEELYKQLENFPEENREQIKKQIEQMSNEQLEEFVKKNQLTHLDEGKCIFCSIVDKTTPSIQIDENEIAIAILDINPVSKGQTLIIPKDHDAENSQNLQDFAFKVGKKLLDTLMPKDITTRAMQLMGHNVLNVIPIYEDTDLEKRTQASSENLQRIADQIQGIERMNQETEQSITGEQIENKTEEQPSLPTNKEEKRTTLPPRIP